MKDKERNEKLETEIANNIKKNKNECGKEARER